MAEQVVLGSFSTLQNSSIIATLNANNTLIENAFLDCVSLAGTLPNAMQSNLDMNNNQIINLPAPSTLDSPVRVTDLTATTSSLSPSLFALLGATNNFTNINTFSNTTQSTTSTNGAVIISGGLGVAKNLSVGGALQITGSFNTASIFGGTAAGSTLTLTSTSNVSPSGDITKLRGTTLLFQSASGGTTFGDYNQTTASTWTLTGNVNVIGNFGVTGSSSTFSFSGANLGLGTATPATHAGTATLTANGTTGGSIDFQTAGSAAARIFNNGATNLTYSLTSASGTFLWQVNTSTTKLDYNVTNANAWSFVGSVFINGSIIDSGGNITASTIAGGSAVGSTLTLESTSNGTPSGDSISVQGSKIFLKSATGGTTFADYNNTTANSWTFSGSGGLYSTTLKSLSTLIINPVTNLQFQLNSVAVGDFALTTANVWTFNTKVTGTGLFGTSSAGSAPAPSLYVGNVTTGLYSVSTTGLGIAVNGTGIGDFGITNANAWTFRGSAGVVIDTAVGTLLSATSANTGGSNNLNVTNTGTGSTVNTAASSNWILSSILNAQLTLQSLGGATPLGRIFTLAGLSGGLSLITLAGPILLNALTSIQFQSNSVAVADYGSTVASTWTLANNVVLGSSTGTLKVGGSGMTTANGSVATTMTSLGPVGSHTTIQEWMVVTNPSGTVRYIPLY